jgi:hypothetical protein
MNILFKLSFSILFCVHLCCYGQVNHNTLASNDIQGGWRCFEIYRDYFNSSSPYMKGEKSVQLVNEHWFISKDSIFQFEYPCSKINENSYKTQSDSILYDSQRIAYYHIEIKNDTMILIGGTDPLYIKKLTRISLDTNIIKSLKINSINLACYIGKLKIKQYETLKNGSIKKLKYPVKMPAYINIIDKKMAEKLYNEKVIALIVDGKKRDFIFSNIGWYKSNKDPKGIEKSV